MRGVLSECKRLKTSPSQITNLMSTPKYRRKGIRRPKVPHKPAAIRPPERVTSYKLLVQRCLSMGLLLEKASSIKICRLERALKHGDFPEVNQLVRPVSLDRERCSNPEIIKGKAAILGPAYMTRLKHRSMIIRARCSMKLPLS